MSASVSILGGNGMLGYDIRLCLASQNFDVKVFDIPDFDIRNSTHLDYAVKSSNVIVNCAAYTAVDKAESEPEICRDINALALIPLCEAIRKYDKYLVHIGTDFVFGDASDNAHLETDIPSPLSVYGRTKLEGEQTVLASGCKASVMRVQWTYGKNGNNFVRKIIELASRLESLKVVDDQIGSPTHTADAAKAVLALIGKQAEGLFHFAAKGYASRFEVAELIFKEQNIAKPLYRVKTSDFSTPAARPLNSRFNCDKIDALLDFGRPFWKDALKSFLKQNFPSQQ